MERPARQLEAVRAIVGIAPEPVDRPHLIEAVEYWLASAGQPSFLIVGPPGTGKSTLLAQIAEQCLAPSRHRKGLSGVTLVLAHFCQVTDERTLDPLDFVLALSESLAAVVAGFSAALGRHVLPGITIESHGSVEIHGDVHGGAEVAGVRLNVSRDLPVRRAFAQLVRRPLEECEDPGPLLVIVDDLSAASQYDPEFSIASLLSVVTDLPEELPSSLRFLLSSRSDPEALRGFRPADIDLALQGLGVTEDMRDYLWHRLTPLPERLRAFWTDAIANASQGNFLVARHLVDDLLADIQHLTEDPNAIRELPSTLTEVYDRWLTGHLTRNRNTWRQLYRPVLCALTVARGAGLNRRQLASVTNLKLQAVRDIVDDCAQYLLGTDSQEGPVRLYHDSFREFLLERIVADEVEWHVAIIDHFVGVFGGNWLAAEDYAKRHIVVHAAAAGRLGSLLAEPTLLVAAEPTALIRVLPEPTDREPDIVRAYRDAAWLLPGRAQEERAFYLLIAALRESAEGLAADLAALPIWADAAWKPLWSAQVAHRTSRIIGSHGVGVTGLVLLRHDGRPVLASIGENGTLRLWDPRTSTALRETVSVGQEGAYGIAAFEIDDRSVLLIRTGWTIELVDAQTFEVLATMAWPQDAPPVTACAVGRLGGRRVVVTGDGVGAVCIYELPAWSSLGPCWEGHSGPVLGLAWLPGTEARVCSTGADGVARVWQVTEAGLGEAATLETPDASWLGAVAASAGEGERAWAMGAADGRVIVFREADGWIDHQFNAHQASGCVARYAKRDGQPYTLTIRGAVQTYNDLLELRRDEIEFDRTGRAYQAGEADARSDVEQRATAPLVALRGGVNALAVLEYGGRHLVVSGGEDGRLVLIVDPPGRGKLVTQMSSPVGAVSLDRLDDGVVLTAAQAEGTGILHAWRLTDSEDPLPPMVGSIDADPVALTPVPTLSGIAIATANRRVLLIEATTGQPVGPPLDCGPLAPKALAINTALYETLAVAGVDEAAGCAVIQLWDVKSGRLEHEQAIPDLSAALSVTALSDDAFAVVGPLAEDAAEDTSDVWLLRRSGSRWQAVAISWTMQKDSQGNTHKPPVYYNEGMTVTVEHDDREWIARRSDQRGGLLFVAQGAKSTEIIVGDDQDMWILDLDSKLLRPLGGLWNAKATVRVVRGGRPALLGPGAGGGAELVFLDREGERLVPAQGPPHGWLPDLTTVGPLGAGLLHATTADGWLLVWDDVNRLPATTYVGFAARYSVSLGNILILATNEELIALEVHHHNVSSHRSSA